MPKTDGVVSTPGEILLEEFLEPLGISQYRLAKAIQKPQSAISDIVHGRRAITIEMAWLLSKALGTTPEFWLNLENTYQLKTFNRDALPDVEKLVAPKAPQGTITPDSNHACVTPNAKYSIQATRSLPKNIERRPSILIREARRAYDEELFIACLIMILTVPEVCSKTLKWKHPDKKITVYEWCSEYLGIPEKAKLFNLERKNKDKTQNEITEDLNALKAQGEFTSSDFFQLRNAILHTGSSIIEGKGAKHSPYHAIGVYLTDSRNQLVISVGAKGNPALSTETQANETERTIKNIQFDISISLTALLTKMEQGVNAFLKDYPDLDIEYGKWDSLKFGIVDMRTSDQRRIQHNEKAI